MADVAHLRPGGVGELIWREKGLPGTGNVTDGRRRGWLEGGRESGLTALPLQGTFDDALPDKGAEQDIASVPSGVATLVRWQHLGYGRVGIGVPQSLS